MVGLENLYGDDKVISSCAIFGMLDLSGRRVDGGMAVEAMKRMRVRGNGLGAGFAAYGIYPKYSDLYALHVMYMSKEAKKRVEGILDEVLDVVMEEEIPTEDVPGLRNIPTLWRYFVSPKSEKAVFRIVMFINAEVKGAYVFSSGKNMGIFKGTGYPEDIARFYRLEEYEGYMWLAHSRFPTNSPGWWGGAHPFGLLDWSVVHNGEISSYGTNRRFLEMYGYKCSLYTDSEVIAYALDFLVRRQGIGIEQACAVLSPPLRLSDGPLRQAFPYVRLSGPFAVIFAKEGEMVGLRDRLGLRPLVAATRRNRFYLSSEEAAIRAVEPDLDAVWRPRGGRPVIGRLAPRPLVVKV